MGHSRSSGSIWVIVEISAYRKLFQRIVEVLVCRHNRDPIRFISKFPVSLGLLRCAGIGLRFIKEALIYGLVQGSLATFQVSMIYAQAGKILEVECTNSCIDRWDQIYMLLPRCHF